jgi:hypothetical protein
LFRLKLTSTSRIPMKQPSSTSAMELFFKDRVSHVEHRLPLMSTG